MQRHLRTITPRGCPARSVSTFRPLCRVAVALKAEAQVEKLPLNFYKLLGLNRASSREAVKRSYERVLRGAADLGYSEEALFSRAVLLKAAADVLSDPDARRAYDHKHFKEQQEFEVSTEDAVGALILLQETGQHDATIAFGHRLLEQGRTAVGARDAAIATALAHCDRAGDALESGASAATACTDLEAGLELLEQHRAAPKVQAEIVRTLEELGPRYCLELLALPLGPQHALARAKGHGILRHVVWDSPNLSTSMGAREQLMDQAKHLLTAAEEIALYKDLPEHARVSFAEVLDVALAYIAHGFASRQPQMVQKADEMLARVQAAAEQLPPDEAAQLAQVVVERAVCAVLLGRPTAAAEMLGLEGPAGGPLGGPAAEASEFVLERCGPGGDLQPGLQALSETWLREAALPSFREHVAGEGGSSSSALAGLVSLSSWFQEPSVKRFLQMASLKERVGFLGIFGMLAGNQGKGRLAQQQQQQQEEEEAAAAAAAAATQVEQRESSRRSLLEQEAARHVVAAKQAVQLEPAAAKAGHVTAAAAAAAAPAAAAPAAAAPAAAAAAAPAAAAPAATADEVTAAEQQQQQQQQQSAEDELLIAPGDVDISRLPADRITVHQLKSRLSRALEDDRVDAEMLRQQQWQQEQQQQDEEEAQGVDSPEEVPEQRPASVTRNLKQLEMQMWDIRPASPWRTLLQSAAQLAGATALMLGALHLARAYRQQQALQVQTQASQPAAAATVAARSHPAAAAAAAAVAPVAITPQELGINRAAAEKLLRRWVEVKSAALGMRHDASQLEQLLSGPMLQKWQGLVQSMKQQGLSWEYDVCKIRVSDVHAAAGDAAPGAVDVTVTVEEAARLMQQGQQVQGYKTTCKMVYRLQQQGQQGWRIVACDVLSQG